jgi:hypothetical protein
MQCCLLSSRKNLECRKTRLLTILLQKNVENDKESHSHPPLKYDGKRHAKCSSSKCGLVAHKHGCILRSLTSKSLRIYYFFLLYFDFSFVPTKSLPDNKMLSRCTSYTPSVRHSSHLSEFHYLYWFSPYLFPLDRPISIFPTYHPCLHGMLACRQADVNSFTYPLFHSQFAVHRNSIAIRIEAS